MSDQPLQPARSTIPRPFTSLVGRSREIASISQLVSDPGVALVTLVGAGGIGKTRLAIQVGLEAQGFPDGRWFVDLAGVPDPALVLPRIAQALAIRETGNLPIEQQLVTRLTGQDALLILDNFEHLLDASVAVSTLVRRCGTMTVLVTSRSPLRVAAERVYPVEPLPLPKTGDTPVDAAANDAVNLFVQRARAVAADFTPSPADLASIVEICRRLSGLPLAIELAAARLKVLLPHALLSRLSHQLQLLSGGPADAPGRLRSMRDAIQWSYDLLPPESRRLLQALSVFSGTIPLDGAEIVAESLAAEDDSLTLEIIHSLVDASLLAPRHDDEREPRFLMLESVREFAKESLHASGYHEIPARAHARWILRLVERQDPLLHSSSERVAMRRLTADFDNIRAAVDASLLLGDIETALLIAGSLWILWSFGGRASEGEMWTSRALASAAGQPVSPQALLSAHHAAGMVKWTRGELTPAEEHFRRCLDLARRISDPESLSQSLMWLSQVAWYKGDFDAMRHYAHESIDAAPPDLPSPNRASAFTLLGIASTRQGRTAEARAELECALSIHRGADFSRGAIWTLQCLADLSHDEGKHGDSAQQHRESLDLCLAAENYWGIFEDVAGLLRLAIDLAMLEEAAALLVVADSLRTTFTVLPREGKWITDNQRELLERMSIKDTSARQLDPAIPEDLVEMVDIARRIATQMADRSDLVPGALPGPTGEAGADPFGLSARERDVLKLLVEGLTDRQIAEALFISHGTARTHVGHVLAKLDARNRAMAVRLAHEYRLV